MGFSTPSSNASSEVGQRCSGVYLNGVKIRHVPVLLEEVLCWLRPVPGGRYLDGTVGLGGHAEGILKESSPNGVLFGLDWDEEALHHARVRLEPFGERTFLIQGDFKDLAEIGKERGISELDGVLFDLGVSSLQLEVEERGFAFSRDGPLDMRMDRRLSLNAADLVSHLAEDDLADLIWRFGEEREAKRIARRIVQFRQKKEITRTQQLAEIVRQAVRSRSGRFRIHPATRTFQALRIAVNRELEGLEQAIRAAVDLLQSRGRIAVISYHSLEDRIVKQTLVSLSRHSGFSSPGEIRDAPEEPRVMRLSKKPITPKPAEVKGNPRCRSAKLRVAEKI